MGQYGAGLCLEQERCLPIRSLACTIPCAASLRSVVRGCWNPRRKPTVSKLFSRQWCAPAERCAYPKFPSSFVNAYTGNRKCRSALRCDFFSTGCTRPSSTSAACLGVKQVPAWLAQQRVYIQRLQESSADASRQTRLELSPSTTTITSLPGRVPLAIKHLPAASVYPVFIPLQ